ncbi:MAG: hypothetical protein LBL19_00215 [Spirochaetaceae bacterium]|nr:hypothetical protein [Spirochaetaceae bacterium]
MADIGLRPGLYIDVPDVMVDKREFFITPQVEYGHSFGIFDVYAKGEYTFGITAFYPQFFFAEERIAARLSLGSRSQFRIALHHENDLRMDLDHDGGQGAGKVTPELKYSLFLPPGDISLALGTPLTYPLWGGGDDSLFGLEVTAAYVTPFWLGFEAAVDIEATPAAVFDGMKFAANYTGDQFYGELAFKAKNSFSYFSLKAEFNYFFNFFILWGALEFKNLNIRVAPVLAPAIGIKYRL